jgi:hypothetical protein
VWMPPEGGTHNLKQLRFQCTKADDDNLAHTYRIIESRLLDRRPAMRDHPEQAVYRQMQEQVNDQPYNIGEPEL